MTVTYMPPLTSAPPDHRQVQEAILEGPAYARTRSMGRWHRVRSGHRWMVEYDPDVLRESWSSWCGQIIHGARAPIFSDEPPALDPRCGTCEGRAIGADPDRPEWLFEPRLLKRPKVCPGSRTLMVREDQGAYNRATCLVCMDVVKMRASGGWYNSRWGAQNHPPGAGLVDPCQFHGWKQLRVVDGAAVCACEAPR